MIDIFDLKEVSMVSFSPYKHSCCYHPAWLHVAVSMCNQMVTSEIRNLFHARFLSKLIN